MSAQRFLIYSQPRTGSTWLVDLLNNHPEIECDGELFSADWKHSRRVWSRRLLRSCPIPYLQLRAALCKAPAYGFKILHYQAYHQKGLLTKLHRRGWKIIHLSRLHLWNQAVSDQLAIQTKRYHRTPNDPVQADPVRIEPAAILNKIDSLKRQSHDETRALEGIPHLPIEYERDLVDDTVRGLTLSRIHVMLGVSAIPGSSVFLPTYDRPMHQLVANYEEIVDCVRHSCHADVLACDEQRLTRRNSLAAGS
jgi:LPS sulfotransferase NodH